MRGKSAGFRALAAIFLFLPVPVLAHHGSASFETKEVTLQGTITEFDWSNPHTEIYFDVKESNGKVVHWGCETLSPAKLKRAGWDSKIVKPGDMVTIDLVAARNGAPVGYLHRLVLPDGRMFAVEEQRQ